MARTSAAPDSNAKPSLTVIDVGTQQPFPVEGSATLGAAYMQIVDNTGTPIVSFGGGTQYTDGAAPPANPIGPTLLWNNAGTWKAVSDTQPLPITVKNTSVPVIGTFWQTTQPVSIASMPTTPVTGTFWQTTQPVSIATAPVLVAGTALIGKVGIDQTTPGTTNAVSIAQIGGTTVVNGGLAGSQSVGGTVGTNVAITDNPVNTGGQGVSSENSAVTTGRKVQFVADLVGKQIVLPYANPENFVSGRASATDTTSTSLIAAPAAGLRNYITQITVWNSSAVSTYIKIQDGTGGTEIYDIPAPAGGGATLTLPTPLRQPTTATALFFAANASANAIIISASGYKGA